MKCILCAFWQMGFDHVCLHPSSPRFKQEVNADEQACEMFIVENVKDL